MTEALLKQLMAVTEEERAILKGRSSIDRDLYMQDQDHTVNAGKLLAAGKLITLRTHTRFIRFPEHRHDYVEVVYMCQGTTTHIVNGRPICLAAGDLLFLGQTATHEVLECGEGDVAVNFIVLPAFFDTTLANIGEEETPLRRFLVDCLCGQNRGPDYLHFQASGLLPVQNLAENLIHILFYDTPNRRKASQLTMSLLFLMLSDSTETLVTESQDQAAVLRVLEYVESHYAQGSFLELAKLLHYDPSWLSRQIKQKTGKTYTQLVQEKRLAQAAFLLRNTDRNVDRIANAVGYENISHFHRIFRSAYGKSPKHYRDSANVQEMTLF